METRALLAGDLVISEFLAANNGGLKDKDGDASDWIEIHNTTAAPVNLLGWSLTDKKSNLDKWTFPDVTLDAGGYLVVFASGKDLSVTGQQLHTDFSLDAGGEYLALVRPDHTTIESEYTLEFPPQHTDISFGVGQTTTVTTLAPAGAPAKVFVPANGNLGSAWTGGAEPFNDSAWTSGSSNIGYELLVPGFAVKNFKANVTVDSLATAEAVIGTPGMQTSLASANTPVINFLGGSGDAHYANNLGFPGRAVGVDVEDFVIEAKASLTIPAPGNWTFGVNSDDGFRLQILRPGDTPFTVEYPAPRGPNDTLATFNFTAAGIYDLRLVMYERGGGDEVELFAAQGTYTTWNVNSFRLVGDTAGGGLKVESSNVGGAGSSGFRSLITTDVQNVMAGINATAYVRVPFNVADPAAYTSLFLRMKYDDGFVAYLNGTEIARRNAPAALTYNSSATSDHLAAQAVVFEDININPFLGSLHAGQNILAIQALNDSAGGNDFLVIPELAQIVTQQTAQRYFTIPTPGSANNSAGVIDFVSDLQLSAVHGFYDSPFDLTITTATAGATIRYTTDGSAPSATNGTVYTGPIHVANTTTLRAFAYLATFEPTVSITETYIFLDNVLAQTRPTSYPTSWGAGIGDYDMDPNVVNSAAYAATIKNDLKTIPSLSIVMNVNDLFGAGGIYSNPTQEGVAWERPGSFEGIFPDGQPGFQINAGVRMYGGVGRYEQFRKHSFRVSFKDDYGPTKLDFPLFPDSDVQKFDSLILRSGFNNSWHRQDIGEATQAEFIQDQWMRDAQLDMGEPGSHGRFVHLYVNGLYWGLYNAVERPDAAFAASHLGGDKDNWDALNSSNAINGDRVAWDALMSLVNAGVTTDAQYQAVKQYVDVTNLIDYMIINFYGGNNDWDDHNWYAARERVPGAGYKFFNWDAERTLEGVNGNDRTGVGQADKPSRIYSQLRGNAEFRLQFADRVYKHLFNEGALTPANNAARFKARADEIDRAIVGESARWGDVSRPNAFTRNVEWLNEVNRLYAQYFPQRTTVLLNQLKAASLYPNVDAPTMNRHGGSYVTPFGLTLTAPVGTIYYTLDGSDPRLPGGAIKPGALSYSGAIALSGTLTVKARALSGTTWSALDEATFTEDVSALRVVEIMYNPAPPAVGSPYTSSDFEFLEVQNTGTSAVNVGGTRLAAGVDYVFPSLTLAPGQRVVVASNPTAFASRYPGVTPIGAFTGNLDNSGERVLIENALGSAVLDFSYNDSWYPVTEGVGYSLVIINAAAPTSSWSIKESWRPSFTNGGGPGAADPGLNPGSLVINEVLSNTSDPLFGDRIELRNTTAQAIDVGGWWLSNSASELTRYQIPGGTSIPAGGYLVLNQLQQFGLAGAPGAATPFELDALGGQVFLTANDNGNLAGYREEEDFGAAEPDVSFGRYTKSTGGVDFVAMSAATFGAANAYPKVGPVVINENMYHPIGSGDEFIELLNITGNPVPLFDPANPANTWQFTQGITYSFPTGTTLAGGSYALVVGIDPQAFRDRYNIAASVPVFGPYAGVLDNAGETLELSKPGAPPAVAAVPYISVDHVKFQPDAPWATQADGTGSSLFRFAAADYGNDVANWQPSTVGGTPGSLNVGLDLTPPSVPTNLVATVASTTRINLSWTPSVDPHTGVNHYRIFRGGLEIGTSTTASFSDLSAVAGVDYSYQVSAVNGDGFESVKSTPLLTTILGLFAVSSSDSTHVTVTFTDTVQQASAINVANYTIPGLVVTGATLAADNKTVSLTTSAQVSDTSYTLSVSGVAGTSGSLIPAGTQRLFTAGQGVGLRAEYYDNMDFTGALIVRTDTTIDFDWGEGSPDPAMGVNQFSVRWTGTVRAQFSETYTFYTVSDDGVRLFINNQQVINNYADHGPTENAGTFTMQAGQRYAIRMEFYENGGGAVAKLLWSSPSTPKQTIPRQQLFLPPQIFITDISLAEGNTGTKQFNFSVNLSASSPIPVIVAYTTAGGTAVVPDDYTTKSGVLTFDPGVTSQTIGISVNGDLTPEGNDTFFVNLSAPTVATIADGQGVGTILDDDSVSVTGRRVFYNNSVFDDNNSALGSSDDAAIASDKTALLPGSTATGVNYTNFSRGINGIMVDILHPLSTPTAADFAFRVGNSNTPGSWSAAPAPLSVVVRPAGGTGGADRVTLAWADDAIRNQWLQVTVLAGGPAGLVTPDVFYFGNAVGDSGNDSTSAIVNASDEIAARNNPRTFVNPATMGDWPDFNRDGFVNAADQIIARSNATPLGSELKLISVPVSLAGTLSLAPQLVDSALAESVGIALDATGPVASLQSIEPDKVQSPADAGSSALGPLAVEFDPYHDRGLDPARSSGEDVGITTSGGDDLDDLLELLYGPAVLSL